MNEESARMQLTKASLQIEMEKNWTTKAFFSSSTLTRLANGRVVRSEFELHEQSIFLLKSTPCWRNEEIHSLVLFIIVAIETTVLYSWTSFLIYSSCFFYPSLFKQTRIFVFCLSLGRSFNYYDYKYFSISPSLSLYQWYFCYWTYWGTLIGKSSKIISISIKSEIWALCRLRTSKFNNTKSVAVVLISIFSWRIKGYDNKLLNSFFVIVWHIFLSHVFIISC